MEPEPERARNLAAEVRGLIEDLRQARDARRDAPSPVLLSHPEDTVYHPDDQQDPYHTVPTVNGAQVAPAQNGPGPQYANNQRSVVAPPVQAAPEFAEHKPQNAKPSAPAPKRFAKLREFFGGKRPAQEAVTTVAFEDRPVPTPASSPEERQAYLTAAAGAGYNIEPNDLDRFLRRVKASGEVGTTQDQLDVKRGGGEGALAELLMKQKPQLVDAARFANRAQYDAQEPFVPQHARDFDVANVLANEARFNGAMDRVAKMAPLTPNAGYARFTEVREALRAVGVRVTVKDFEQFKKEVKREWTADLMRENDKSLGTQALLDMTLPPASRRLIGSDAQSWNSVLRKNQQFPEHDERREFLQRQAAETAEPITPNNLLPPQPPKMIRDGFQRAVPPGYSQDGKITYIDEQNGLVFQATRSAGAPGQRAAAVRYDLADITKAIPLEDLKTAMERGHDVNVSLRNNVFDVVDRDYVPRFELNDLDRAAANLEDPEMLETLANDAEAVEIER
jgi:hypothetical protein